MALVAALRGWGYYETLLVYWLEAVVVGGYNLLRLVVVGLLGEEPFGAWLGRHVSVSWGARLLGTALGAGFFAVKFGAAVLGVGLLVAALPAAFAGPEESGGHTVWRALVAVGPGVAAAAGLLVLSHGYSFVRHFLVGREYRRRTVLGLVFWPYARLSLVVVVLGAGIGLAALLPGLRSTAVFAVTMALVKLLADAATHVAEHRRFAARPPAGPAA